MNFDMLIKKQTRAPWIPKLKDSLDTSCFNSLVSTSDEFEQISSQAINSCNDLDWDKDF